jgi:hypothetical protein
VALGFMGMAGGVSNLIADLIPVLGEAGWPLLLQQIVGCSAFFSATMFGYVYSVPPVTGGSWYEGPAGLSWSIASAYSFFGMVVTWAAIPWNVKRGGDSPILRNAGLVAIGPIISAIFAVATGVPTLIACVKDGVNPYTTFVNMAGTISGGIQPLRIGIREGNGPDKVRAGIVGLVDVVSTEAAALMLVLSGILSSSPVIVSTLPKGRVGEAYMHTLVASNGNAVFNAPLHKWKAVGPTPTWLEIKENGKISGTPLQHGIHTFRLTCANSFGPNQYSEVTEVVLEVLP